MQQIKNQKGTSLLELLVAMTLFTVILLSATSIFKMVIDGQRNAVSAQNVQENIRYAMEKMSKEIRMAKIMNHSPANNDHDCKQLFNDPDPAFNKVFDTIVLNNGVTALMFENKDSVCVAYYLENNRIKIRIRQISNGATFEDFVTPLNTQVSNLKFSVVDDQMGAFHSVQPYVTMVMTIKAIGLAMHQQEMKIQTTISSRYYE